MSLPHSIYPPRPQGRLLWKHLSRYESTGEWVAQLKFNGKHVVVFVNPHTGECGVWGREKEPLERFRFTAALQRQFLSLHLESPVWLAGELLHQKTKSLEYQGKFVLFDVLGCGNRLVDDDAADLFIRKAQMERLAVLADICHHPTHLEPTHGIALCVTTDIWMAQTWEDNFLSHFKQFIQTPEIEGLVLRRRKGEIRNFCQKYWETSDLIRVRKESKSYTH